MTTDARAAYLKRYRETHREELRAYARALPYNAAAQARYRASHREERRASQARYREANRELLRLRDAAYRKAHRGTDRAIRNSRSVRIAGERLYLGKSVPPHVQEIGLLLKQARRVIQESQKGALTP